MIAMMITPMKSCDIPRLAAAADTLSTSNLLITQVAARLHRATEEASLNLARAAPDQTVGSAVARVVPASTV